MKEFLFKEIDQEGLDTLDAIAAADKFNYWMYETIQPFCKGQILEIGSGIGNISKYFLADQADMTLSDIRQNYCLHLSQQFEGDPNLRAVLDLDLVDPNFDTKFASHLEQYDCVFALNVVEHIKDDALALQNGKKLLKKGGHMVVLVPAYQLLYNRFDQELEHYRRYTKTTLHQLMVANGFAIMHQQYFNAMGILGWVVSGRILQKKTIPKNQMKLYNTLVPIFRVIDKLLFHKVGLSVITIGKK